MSNERDVPEPSPAEPEALRSGMEPPRYTSIWQCVGMIVGVYDLIWWPAFAAILWRAARSR